MRKQFVLLCVLLTVSFSAAADTSAYDQAAQKLATKPATTRPAAELLAENYQLRQENISLKNRITALADKVKQLEASIASAADKQNEPKKPEAQIADADQQQRDYPAIGSTEAQCDEFEKQWNTVKEVVTDAVDGRVVRYMSPSGGPRDICYFDAIGKLVEVKPFRTNKYTPGRSVQASPFSR